MALSSSSNSPVSSPFPETPAALTRPEQAAVRSQYYDNYNSAFSEDTSYSNNYSDSSNAKSLTLPRPSSAFGNRVLSAITENANSSGLVATACSLTRKASYHARAKSLANFVPSLNPTDTEEQKGSTRSKSPSKGRLSDIFTQRRSSIAPEDDEESEFIMTYKSSLTGGARGQPEPQAPAPRPTGIRSFSWFGSTKQSPPSPPPTQTESTVNVDLMSASPTALLFPAGSPNDKTSASFDELLRNAEFLISRLQTACKEQSSALHTARSEREALAEEAEEANTRARHLKLQLDDLAARVADQDITNRALAEELAAEKQRRHEDREQYERMARQNELTPRRSRHSGASSLASDSGFESEADTASSCSRPITPTSPHPPHYALNDRWSSVMEPIKEVRPASRDEESARISGRTCEIDAGVWMFMREEKVRLQRRVNELEGVLDGCLDLIA